HGFVMISNIFCVEQVRSEQFRRARCGNSARRDLYGGGWVTGRPTVIIIIDVRSSSEYQTSHVPGALHIPFWTAFTTDKLDSLKKTDPVILYCEHGPRAGIAKLAISLSGFENISYLAGHMTAWKKAGLPVEK
ncbi:MAG: rhodanese-like domain-containing protein, partial [Methylococcaceae bacterium]